MTHNQLNLSDVPCFRDDQIMKNIKTVNMIYGPNGSGKSSIARLLGEVKQEETLVYDRNYVEVTFAQDSDIPGVFSLGKESAKLQLRITSAKKLRKSLEDEVKEAQESLTSKLEVARVTHTNLKEKIWGKKDTLPTQVIENTTGLKGNKDRLLARLIEMPEQPPGSLPTVESLETRATSLFSEDPKPMPELEREIIDFSLDQESLAMLAMAISPLERNRLSDLIEECDSLQWVKHGKSLLDRMSELDQVCPFCQQVIPSEVVGELDAIISRDYNSQIDRVKTSRTFLLSSISSTENSLTSHRNNLGSLGQEKQYDSIINAISNAKAIVEDSFRKKLEKPESIVDPTRLGETIEALVSAAKVANKAIKDHNSLLQKRKESIKKLATDTFIHLRYTLCVDALAIGIAQVKRDEKEVQAAKDELEILRAKQESVENDLSRLQGQTTSTEATAVKINNLLQNAGFQGFRLRPFGANHEKFRIVRNSESTANFKTLSEGEKTCITLFYYLQTLEAPPRFKQKAPCVAVIDDPISSLDDTTLFFMSRILRDLVRKVDKGDHPNIKQLFLLTHNLKFHKEVCYRPDAAINHYKIDKLRSLQSTISHSGKKNPVKTPYEELWASVRLAMDEPERDCVWLGNVVRRIVESYYEFLGHSDNLYQVDESTSIEDRILHEAVVAWSHGKSHKTYEQDALLSPNSTPVGWIDALRNLFERTGNIAHFNAMTGANHNS